MAASFPTTVKSFTTRVSSDTIQPAHMNDVQDEVAAIAQALVVSGTVPGAVTWSGAHIFTGGPTFGTGTQSSPLRVRAADDAIALAFYDAGGTAEWGFFINAAGLLALQEIVTGFPVLSVTPVTGLITMRKSVTSNEAIITGSTAEITPAALSGDVNNYTPTGLAAAQVLRVSGTGAARTITGLAAGTAGQWLLVVNHGAENIVLANESGSSDAANRFACPGAANATLHAGDSMWAYYEHASSRWRVVGV